MTAPTTSARDRILARIRAAVADAPEPPPVLRDYRDSHHPADPARLLDLLAENLADYRALVHRCTEAELPALIGRILAERGSHTLLVPDGVPEPWLTDARVDLVRDDPPLAPDRLDAVDSVLTGCALAIAETGTIVLDAGPGQGRRALTLVPDHHLCVIRAADQVVASVPHAMPRLDPARPQTWISGPSATSDIELDRVEGVHGPRTLEVVLVE
ncbi:LutC/YkgG family protein [Streptacidiphilus carbonis]|jgi:L-lactate dehydrogenase complex protein LldG|uniref:LutC/YkgG family protein n=1 Tax=Streptacidiphilus carbonis TaxID=105422 RepID=UPI0005A91F60|nr:LUD domain-containing protein [Streptacidiphilus carbonis]